MSGHGIAAEYFALVDGMARAEEEALGAGKASGWDDYKRRVGYLQGLRAAKNALHTAARKYLEEGSLIDEY
jgi:hypothetical protein